MATTRRPRPIAAAGVDLTDVFDVLETEGVDKFIASWNDLVASVTAAQASVAAR